MPLTHEAFVEYRLGGVHLSTTGLAAIRRMLAGETVDQKASGLGKREWRELMAALGLGDCGRIVWPVTTGQWPAFLVNMQSERKSP